MRLSDEAPEETITALAERGAGLITELLAERGGSLPRFDSRVREDISAEAMTALMAEHMNAAQQRALDLIIEHLTRTDQ